MKIQPESNEQPQQPMASTKSDLRNLRDNSSATVAELKAFLKQLQGKSPQEMLGIVAGSQLIRAIGVATVLVLVAGLIFTAIPYARGAGKEKENAAQQNPEGPTAAEPAIPKPTPAAPTPNNPAPNTPANPLTPTTPNLSNLGVTEEKKAPPNENPLESKEDDFLKGLE